MYTAIAVYIDLTRHKFFIVCEYVSVSVTAETQFLYVVNMFMFLWQLSRDTTLTLIGWDTNFTLIGCDATFVYVPATTFTRHVIGLIHVWEYESCHTWHDSCNFHVDRVMNMLCQNFHETRDMNFHETRDTTHTRDTWHELSRVCVAVCCSVLQCVAVCCSVLQCVAVTHTRDTWHERSRDTWHVWHSIWGWLRLVAPSNCRSLLQNIVSFVGLFCKRDL